ncbi:MAG: type II toxin-antitoxin system prevent-host-death family antitoxin [Opitutaceae bacterium]
MKRKKPVLRNYPEAKDSGATLHEAALAAEREVLGVREAKDQLSSLLQRAAAGEEIVITSDGVPTAMIVRYKPALKGKPFKPHWNLLRSMPVSPDSTALIRKMRDGRY